VSVTFASSGAVQRVEVSGTAASDAGMSRCLKGAFGKAKVPPFSDPTYNIGATVRP
jgi:hypothetical protein